MTDRKFVIVFDDNEKLEFQIDGIWDWRWGENALSIQTDTQDIIIRKDHIKYTVYDIDKISIDDRRGWNAV